MYLEIPHLVSKRCGNGKVKSYVRVNLGTNAALA
jgi:hypothetical protein